jgi:hypothetical protein
MLLRPYGGIGWRTRTVSDATESWDILSPFFCCWLIFLVLTAGFVMLQIESYLLAQAVRVHK